jgi:hypothetical protein
VDLLAVAAEELLLRAIADLKAIEAEHEGDEEATLQALARKSGIPAELLVTISATIAETFSSRSGSACAGILLGVSLGRAHLP